MKFIIIFIFEHYLQIVHHFFFYFQNSLRYNLSLHPDKIIYFLFFLLYNRYIHVLINYYFSFIALWIRFYFIITFGFWFWIILPGSNFIIVSSGARAHGKRRARVRTACKSTWLVARCWSLSPRRLRCSSCSPFQSSHTRAYLHS